MEHVILQMQSLAGKIRGTSFTPQEASQLTALVDKTLAPDSKLFELIQSRVKSHMLCLLQGKQIDTDLLSKHGLTHLEDKIKELGVKIDKVLQLNTKIFAKLYTALLEDVKKELDGSKPKKDSEIVSDLNAMAKI
jgi:hypothetical protein